MKFTYLSVTPLHLSKLHYPINDQVKAIIQCQSQIKQYSSQAIISRMFISTARIPPVHHQEHVILTTLLKHIKRKTVYILT